jgi:hypothetical protein
MRILIQLAVDHMAASNFSGNASGMANSLLSGLLS